MTNHTLDEAATLLEYERHNLRILGRPEPTTAEWVMLARTDLTELLVALTGLTDSGIVRGALLVQVARLLGAVEALGVPPREAGGPPPGAVLPPDPATVAGVYNDQPGGAP